MAWNEPGGGKDPWSNPRGRGKPPNIDDALGRLKDRFGGGGGGGMGNAGGSKGILAIIGIVLIGWLISGIYIVDEGQRGIVLTFGKYTSTAGPGPHWHPPYPISDVVTVNVDQYRDRELSMSVLTNDENIVEVDLASQFTVRDPVSFLFNVRDPNGTLQDVMQSATREVIGSSRMDYVLTDGRVEIVDAVRTRMQELLESYKTGLIVRSVNLQDVQPPEPVQPAFEDAIRAREDEQRYINEALAYANQVVPRARGDAAQILEQAKGYKARVINKAQGEAARFDALLESYRIAPAIIRERMYLETLGEIYAKGNKIVVDPANANNILNLPAGVKKDFTQDADSRNTAPLAVPSLTTGQTFGSDSSNTSSNNNRSGLRTRGSE
ncbi:MULTISPECIES: FtsH protease activity modulator HflK [unclassified Guyparkeria]|uniref:FtsH protease activity modulator HflK n=1 Tax=unclassified Guyparkeria TaxID=2626246 RepID=UPI00073366AD|nr:MULTISPECIES: FtsH protease activity modulator HflK [unclassified Guyparkeria]KTG17401.1 HflK protein [Guyparkeria sp. XI15]OAE87378.1 HflK protein [Guyparkeria sp. WRN-7]